MGKHNTRIAIFLKFFDPSLSLGGANEAKRNKHLLKAVVLCKPNVFRSSGVIGETLKLDSTNSIDMYRAVLITHAPLLIEGSPQEGAPPLTAVPQG